MGAICCARRRRCRRLLRLLIGPEARAAARLRRRGQRPRARAPGDRRRAGVQGRVARGRPPVHMPQLASAASGGPSSPTAQTGPSSISPEASAPPGSKPAVERRQPARRPVGRHAPPCSGRRRSTSPETGPPRRRPPARRTSSASPPAAARAGARRRRRRRRRRQRHHLGQRDAGPTGQSATSVSSAAASAASACAQGPQPATCPSNRWRASRRQGIDDEQRDLVRRGVSACVRTSCDRLIRLLLAEGAAEPLANLEHDLLDPLDRQPHAGGHLGVSQLGVVVDQLEHPAGARPDSRPARARPGPAARGRSPTARRSADRSARRPAPRGPRCHRGGARSPPGTPPARWPARAA